MSETCPAKVSEKCPCTRNVQKMLSENAPQMPEDRRCPKLAFRNVLDMPYRPTNQKRKYALFCRWVMPEQDLRGIRKAISGCMRMNMIWA